LAFHKVIARFSYGSTNFSPERFELLLRLLQDRNVRFVPAIYRPKADDGRLPAAFTFDDCYAHLADVLPRLIELFEIQPLIFVPTALIGKSNSWDYSHMFRVDPHMDRQAMRMLAERGVQFGSHGHQHVDLSSLSERRLMIDLRQSKEILEDIIRTEVNTISYPFGRASSTVTDVARACGFKYGYTMRFPTPGDTPETLGRIPIYGYDTPLSISAKLKSSGPLLAIERFKCRVTNSMSGGTVLLNKIRRLS
jgi:peptidoglycan/xylan/chitin deacetylase (PgdA/CDA1 family)